MTQVQVGVPAMDTHYRAVGVVEKNGEALPMG